MNKELAEILKDILNLFDPNLTPDDYKLRSELAYIRAAIDAATEQEMSDG